MAIQGNKVKALFKQAMQVIPHGVNRTYAFCSAPSGFDVGGQLLEFGQFKIYSCTSSPNAPKPEKRKSRWSMRLKYDE